MRSPRDVKGPDPMWHGAFGNRGSKKARASRDSNLDLLIRSVVQGVRAVHGALAAQGSDAVFIR